MHQNIRLIRVKVCRLNICEHIVGLSPTISGPFLFVKAPQASDALFVIVWRPLVRISARSSKTVGEREIVSGNIYIRVRANYPSVPYPQRSG